MEKIKYFVVTFSLILSLALVAGCALAPKVETVPPSSATANTTVPTVSEPLTPVPQSEASPPSVATSQVAPLPSIADVVAKVKPSVVAITTEVVSLDFFNRPFTEEGAGSGWIISGDGYIVTNNHVIQGAKNITVTLEDDRTVPAKIVGVDSLMDLAVLKIDAANLTAVAVGDSTKLRVGDWVVAIGNSLNLGVSPSEGIVRSLRASVPVSAGETLYDLIGTTAPINPGNSGGPLLNMAGEVIGITSAKISAAGVEGMGYAISTREAVPIIQQLISTGYVVRPWLGVSLYTVDQFTVLRYDLAVDKGALIVTVAAGSPADKAGLKPGDVIVSLNSKEIPNAQQLIRAIHATVIGQKVEITFWRGKTKDTVYVTPSESPPPKSN